MCVGVNPTCSAKKACVQTHKLSLVLILAHALLLVLESMTSNVHYIAVIKMTDNY